MGTLTANKGASITRAEIKRHHEGMCRRIDAHIRAIYKELRGTKEFISGMARRASAKKGGLGRK